METISLEKSYLFACPRCHEEFVVDPGMQEMMVDEGCIICDTSITAANFNQVE